ncbi:hypothetical protein GIB67_034132 [Kingdonia uniflora]|uniref:RNase H type-1 domain-containing protein n=1 Tax=Kingdonia uniflora TaxID=39325 RepID=A0A7J7L6H7_9MAGN|nr:hypothetical protein GIB67_034132 [Kingdonia uniflora]
MIEAAGKHSPYLKDLWLGVVWGDSNLIRKARNACVFEGEYFSLDKEKPKWIGKIQETAHLYNSCMNNSISDLSEVKINTDGASKGNSGKGGVGFIIRDNGRNVLRTMSIGMGIGTSFAAECTSIVKWVACTTSNGWLVLLQMAGRWLGLRLTLLLLQWLSTQARFLGVLRMNGLKLEEI